MEEMRNGAKETVEQAQERITKMAQDVYPSELEYAERARALYVRNRMETEGFASEGLTDEEQEELANYVMHL